MLESICPFVLKLKIIHATETPLQGIHPTKTHEEETSRGIYNNVLGSIVLNIPNWKQPQIPPRVEWINCGTDTQ